MYISRMVLQNFKCFEGEVEFSFSKGLNYLVGNNNTGKTTIFKAIEFLRGGKTKEGWITKGRENEDILVQIDIEGEDLKSLLDSNDNFKKYLPYLMDDCRLRLQRSSKEIDWKDSSKKDKTITIKNVSLWNEDKQSFENPMGIDNNISTLFDAQFVYSDLNNEEYQSFSKSSTIIGKLLNSITKDFQTSEKWNEFKSAHKEAFGDEGLLGTLNELQEQVEGIMKEQYGETKVEFSFGIPTIDNFFKTGRILLEDNGIKTDVSEKGTGMQRALALSLIQLYAQTINTGDSEFKSILFFIDEPETFLHPVAQNKLLNSLNKISENNQIFITTHSPYLLKRYKSDNKLIIFSREPDHPRVKEDTSLTMFPHSPTWGEINYKAFGIGSVEFHIELFGFLHKMASDGNKTYENGQKTVSPKISSFDGWLIEQAPYFDTDDDHQNTHNGYTDKSMISYIRNCIDHPEPGVNLPSGKNRIEPTDDEITKSIQIMVEILKRNFGIE